MLVSLEGRTALVTAGGAGIGRAIAAEFLSSGARVAICDIDEDALNDFERTFPGTLVIKADVSVVAEVDRLFDGIAQSFGGLDILVNNAGISGPTAPIDSIDPGDWDVTMAVNLRGAFLCARRAAPMLRAARDGTIINLSSSAGRLGMPLRAPYVTSKYGIRGLTDTLAMELGEHGVRVNAILPGLVEGPRGERVIGEQAEARGMSYAEYLPMFLHNISLHSAVSVEDVAAMATFLASDCARHVSGQSIGVCGNFESYRAPPMIAAGG